MMREGAAP
uniref:Uncharacterized protein n=1 Tax=Arundo donax TaxID=35708 RepID=A0A0A9EJK8_ARUDO